MHIKNIEKHSYIKLIELSLNNNKFSKNCACKESGLSSKQFDFIRDDIFILSAHQEQSFDSKLEQEWVLTPQSFFSYLQYLEFKHAVRTARIAKYISILAIIISCVFAILQFAA